MEKYSLFCKANITDLFIFIVNKIKISEALYLASGLLHKMEELAKAQFRNISVQETVFQEEGLTRPVANINLPQGE